MKAHTWRPGRVVPRVFLWLVMAGCFGWGPGVSVARAQAGVTALWTLDFWRQVGVSVSAVRVRPTDHDVDPTTNVGFAGGFFPSAGWGPAIGFGWVDTHISSQGTTIARLRARPLMGGVGYTWLHGRLATKASVTAGIVFNHASLDKALVAQVPEPISLEVRNSFAVRAGVTLEYAIVRKLALKGSLNFFATRPTVVLKAAEGEITDRWDANNATLAFGVVFYPLR
jgi:hypothetical protein